MDGISNSTATLVDGTLTCTFNRLKTLGSVATGRLLGAAPDPKFFDLRSSYYLLVASGASDG